MAAKRQEVAKVAPQRASVPGIQEASEEELRDIEGVAGAGLSDNVDDRGTPLLYIAQKGSKQVNKKEAKYVEGLEVGMCFNNLTNEMYDTEAEGVQFLPCFFRVNWNEWTPLEQGGGFHGSHPRDTPLVRKGKVREGRRDIIDLPDGHELILTHHYFGVIPATWSPIIVPMSSTNLGSSTTLQALIGAQKIQTANGIVIKPAFWNTYLLKTVYDSNDKGDWYRYLPSMEGPVEDPQLKAFCKEFALACARNEIKMAAPVDEGTEESKSVPI